MKRRQAGEEDALIRVRVQPKASRNAIVVEPGGRVRVAVTAPPTGGEANKALRVLVAKALRLPRSRVQLVRGERGREKVLRIEGVSGEEANRKLALLNG